MSGEFLSERQGSTEDRSPRWRRGYGTFIIPVLVTGASARITDTGECGGRKGRRGCGGQNGVCQAKRRGTILTIKRRKQKGRAKRCGSQAVRDPRCNQ